MNLTNMDIKGEESKRIIVSLKHNDMVLKFVSLTLLVHLTLSEILSKLAPAMRLDTGNCEWKIIVESRM